jgi:soluble lytic murein transglycosylase-like protein
VPLRLPSRLQPWWALCVEAGARHGLDPLLLLAVLDRESLGGLALKPKGPQGYGDNGHGHGLMQIDDRSHAEFLAERLSDGTPAWADPVRNIDCGARILARCLRVFDGDEFLAAAAYNVGPHAVKGALAELTAPSDEATRRAVVERLTTGHNYPSDVLGRRSQFRIALRTPPEDPPEEPPHAA